MKRNPAAKWEEMTRREREIWLAEFVLGWKRVKQDRQTCSGQDECWQFLNADVSYDSHCVCHFTPHYLDSIEAAFSLEAAIEVVHHSEDLYVEHLWEVVYGRTPRQDLAADGHVVLANRGFRFVHASAEQRAEAAYRTVYLAAVASSEGRL